MPYTLPEIVLNSLLSLIYQQKKKNIIRLTEEFNVRQWLPQDELLTKCDELTFRLLDHACQHVPYYRDIITEQWVSLDNFSFPGDWQRLPLLGKAELKDHFAELISESVCEQKNYLNHTGGSTGVPVNFLTDVIQAQRMTAWLDLVYSWAGWQPGEIRLELWGNKEQRLPLTLWDRARASLSGHCILPVYEYSERTMQHWAVVIEQLKPTIIYGYPSVLADFARWLESENRRIPGIKGVFSSAEVLYPEQRLIIEQVFSCKVYNQYGSRETPCIACECPDGGMHIFVDFNRIEFVDSDDDLFDHKEIIVTPLYNFAQPLIRYRLGDMGTSVEAQCTCGRGYPLMELNIGRSGDIFVGRNGLKFFPSFFIHLLDGKEEIRSFQFIQKQIDHIVLNIEIPGIDNIGGYCTQLVAEIEPILVQKMGNIHFVVNEVAKIDRTSAGKHRFVICEIKNGV